MRDLQKDLEEWITDHDIGKRGEWFYMTGEYIERAIQAEAEVERLQTENALLRKVADAARALVPSEMYQYTRHLFDLKHTLDEYQTWKEGQDGRNL